jgi:hypothetical protein
LWFQESKSSKHNNLRHTKNVDISALLHQHFGFRDFRPGQREVIDELLTQAALSRFSQRGVENRFATSFPRWLWKAPRLWFRRSLR